MESLELTLIIIVIIYIGIFFVNLLWFSKQLEKQTKNYYYGISFFLLMFMITRIFFLINDIIYYQTLDPDAKQGFYYVLGSFTAAIAAFGIMFVVERYIYKKLHYIPSVIILISASLMIILPKINGINMVTIYTLITSGMAALIPILYIIVGLKVSGTPRTKSFILAIGILIFFLSNLFNMGALKEAFPVFIIISPLTLLLGLGIFHYGLVFYKT